MRFDLFKKIIKNKPQIIFHLAAQSSVIQSFKNLGETVQQTYLVLQTYWKQLKILIL